MPTVVHLINDGLTSGFSNSQLETEDFVLTAAWSMEEATNFLTLSLQISREERDKSRPASP